MSNRNKATLGALAILCAGTVDAGTLFNPNGTGLSGALDVGQFDWLPTSILARNGNAAVSNFVNSNGACPANSCDFTVLTHARLGGPSIRTTWYSRCQG